MVIGKRNKAIYIH